MPRERRSSSLPFDLAAATAWLAERDARLARLIAETRPFAIDARARRSPYEALLEAIAHQSISGKAAATIFARIVALGGNGGPPTPDEMLKLRAPALRRAGLSAAEVLAVKDLARKTVAGLVPTRVQARRKGWAVTYGSEQMPSPKELLAFGERWRPYRTVASWYMWRAFERAGYAATNRILPAKVKPKPG